MAVGLVALAALLNATAAVGRADEPPAGARALEAAFEAAIRKAEPSVACILVARGDGARRASLADPDTVPESYGSGVVIDAQGLILTNYHVVRDAAAQGLYVRLPGRKGSFAEVHAADPRSDLAVLRATDPRILPLPAIKMGDGDAVRKGQFVLSIANPFAAGFMDGSPSASWGIISNIRRRAPGRPAPTEQDRSKTTIHHYGTLLQIDARLNLGCSGGALVDLDGNLVGLTTSLAALGGVETPGGFAVPMTAAMKRIVERLREGKEVEYGFLGISPAAGSRRGDGVQVEYVMPGSAAARGGLRPYEKILRIEGRPVRDNDELFLEIGTLLAGTVAHVVTQGPRGFVDEKTVTLDKYYVPGPVIAAHRLPLVHGLRVDYTSVLAQKVNLRSEIPTGVYVSEVRPGSAADKAHLQNTIVVEVNGHPVHDPAEFYRAAGSGPLELTLTERDEAGLPRRVRLD